MSKYQKNNKYIVKALIDTILFIETSPQEIIDEDAGVALMEQIAYELRLMDGVSKNELSQLIMELDSEYPADKKDFIKSIPERLGIF